LKTPIPRNCRAACASASAGPRAGGQSLAAADGRAFSALDVLTAETLRTDLLDLWSEGRMPIKSILIVTHNIEEAVQMCDRILVFRPIRAAWWPRSRWTSPPARPARSPFRALVDDIYARMTARPASPARARWRFPAPASPWSCPMSRPTRWPV
jgi:hypothetical protein